ncbi:MAG: adenylate/guanylate cyclase domain-containing protein [Spirochaetes bacterium]|nr:MAG: adenylate/guanylate cyclase domain-containing protein [Spirochaetota bacterium]
MAKGKKRARILETRYFGFIIGLLVVTLLFFLNTVVKLPLLDTLELKVLDVHFNFKNMVTQTSIQEGVSLARRNPDISEDILIIGIDFKSLDDFGRWPFPRYRHANLIDSFTRIQRQNERERALFLDVFFIEPSDEAHNDALLVNSMRENGRVFLETVLDEVLPPSESADEYFTRQQLLYQGWGEIKNITGNWEDMKAYYGLQPPLQPYARATFGYGHANFTSDVDKIFRRQPLVAKSSVLVDAMRLEDLAVDTPVNRNAFERLVWVDKKGRYHNIPYPLTEDLLQTVKETVEAKAPLRSIDLDGDGKADQSFYLIRKYQDHFVPSITLSLALHYFNKSLSDIEVVLGEYIRIPEPQYFDVKSGQWIPYNIIVKPPEYDTQGNLVSEGKTRVLHEIKIPIDENGNMLINFMGPPSFASPAAWQTFPIRSFSGYASRVPPPDPESWPRTKAVGNKILMVGPFARGMAADEKPTPFGLMYGVEIHANALNTILMNNFLIQASWWINLAVLFVLVMITAFLSSRVSTIWSLVVSLFMILAFFIAVTLIFDEMSYVINFTSPAIGIFFAFLTIVVYRIMTEEKDKARIRDMFGKYVSPKVVEQILENPPELGGVDKDLTVLFSDIRGFTTLSESMTPQELVNHLNLYLTSMTDIILEYEGTLDKYVGDEIMCFWGAPVPQDDHALLACKCALKQMEVLRKLNEQWPQEKRINIGIGINSGIMTVGNMGSLGRMNYTLMGDNVNLGARLEGTNKEYGTNVIMSEYTYGLIKDKVIARELDNIRVKGKNKPVLIYELVDFIDGYEPPARQNASKSKA